MFLNRNIFIYFVSLFIFSIIYYFLGKTFDLTIWNQVNELRNNENPIYFLTNINAFTIRFVFLTYPLFALERFIGLNSEISFHYLCLILIVISAFFLSKITKEFFNINLYLIDLSSITFLFGLAYFANGRLLYSILGIFILFYLSLKFNKFAKNKNFYLLSFGFFFGNILSNASSGTATFAMVITIMTLFSGLFNENSRRFSSLILLLFLFPSFYLFQIYFEKNLAFYSWNIFSMLSHGLGGLVNFNQEVTFLLVILFLFSGYLFFININNYLNLNKFTVLTFFSFVALAIGLFGFSSMLPMLLITFFILMWNFVFQIFLKNDEPPHISN